VALCANSRAEIDWNWLSSAFFVFWISSTLELKGFQDGYEQEFIQLQSKDVREFGEYLEVIWFGRILVLLGFLELVLINLALIVHLMLGSELLNRLKSLYFYLCQ
jgi:hypothetical protein